MGEGFVCKRMKELGILDHLIGKPDYGADGQWRAFDPWERQGGKNTTGAIVDSGVLNPEFLKGKKGGRLWPKMRLKDRIDAIIAREKTETGTQRVCLQVKETETKFVCFGLDASGSRTHHSLERLELGLLADAMHPLDRSVQDVVYKLPRCYPHVLGIGPTETKRWIGVNTSSVSTAATARLSRIRKASALPPTFALSSDWRMSVVSTARRNRPSSKRKRMTRRSERSNPLSQHRFRPLPRRRPGSWQRILAIPV